MTPDQMLAHIAALEAQIDTQARIHTSQCLRLSREVRRREAAERCAEFWKRMAEEKQTGAMPKWVADIIADAEAVFK